VKDQWIDDYVERETPPVTKRGEDTVTVIEEEPEYIWNAEHMGLTCSKPERSYVGMLNAIGDSLSDLASSSDAEVGDDKEDDAHPVWSMQSKHDEAGGVVGTNSTTVQHRV